MILCFSIAAAAAKSLQSCPTLCHPRDDSPPGSPVPGILQARTLEWVAISFSTVSISCCYNYYIQRQYNVSYCLLVFFQMITWVEGSQTDLGSNSA